MVLKMYKDLLRKYEEIKNEINTKVIYEKLSFCKDTVDYLIAVEPNNNFKHAFEHIRSSIIKQTINLGRKRALIEIKIPAASLLNLENCQKNNSAEQMETRSDSLKEFQITEVIPQICGFHEVIGCNEIKKTLQAHFILPLQQPQLFVGLLNTVNSLLLFGPPGTGKTRIAHALASEITCKLYCISPSDILSEYIGKTEKMIKTVFTQIKNSPSMSILFIDEIDGICRKRTGEEQESSRRLKTELMCQLNDFNSNKNAILICATNCPWDLDSAFLRRFQKRIYVPLPDRQERFELLNYYTEKTTLAKTKDSWGPIITQTEGFSGSDLANLVQNALSVPVTELIENKKWKMTDFNMYEPAMENEHFNVIYCGINEIPRNCAKVRNAQISDLIKAVEKIKRTVTVAEDQKYKEYIKQF
ncbi:vacuolar protein sorting-associated protein 4 [Agrilus planipennis]|uniref:Vacuolar protein sorting-associated protein 4 n=1 Tax=Agrilus planipennis TaxID=224129 RepID=A0A1W4WWC5_AGRPL|nr:vacuolar protein sorting-associated protein 4 [Agrilus planipennis]